MKKIYKTIMMIMLVSLIPFNLMAQKDGPPNPEETPTGDAVGEGAPIGSGLIIMLTLGAAYGGKKIYSLSKEELEE